MDEVSLHIDAPAERIYDIVSDLPGMGRWSPENTGGKWLEGETGAKVGARFRGWNKHGVMRWFTTSTITKADRPSCVEWEVRESSTRWGYRLEADGDGTLVTEYREHYRKTNPLVTLFQKSGIIGKEREGLMVEGMKTTLDRVKEAAEAD
jgi:uncharacterized protein YndB with AHSA1/START domain